MILWYILLLWRNILRQFTEFKLFYGRRKHNSINTHESAFLFSGLEKYWNQVNQRQVWKEDEIDFLEAFKNPNLFWVNIFIG